MKILFLDIDGVVNSAQTMKSNPKQHWPLDPYLAFLVGRIALHTQCKVVLSSSWRYHPESVQQISERVTPIFECTPTDRTAAEVRGHEIQRWLDAHPNVEKYAILDDDSDMLESQLPNFFQTSWELGITDEISDKIIKHLKD